MPEPRTLACGEHDRRHTSAHGDAKKVGRFNPTTHASAGEDAPLRFEDQESEEEKIQDDQASTFTSIESESSPHRHQAGDDPDDGGGHDELEHQWGHLGRRTIGRINEARPMESNGSVMLSPMSVPMATPWERLAAISATVNSGSEVRDRTSWYR